MRIFKLLVCVLAFTLISGCAPGGNGENAYEKINKKYINISDYAAGGNITIYGNKSQNTYDFTQYYKNGKYLLQYKDDLGIIFDKKSVVIKNNVLKSQIAFDSDSMDYYYFFVNSFFEKYFTEQNVTVKTASSDNEKFVVLECETGDKHYKKQKLWINAKNTLPSKMQIFDGNDTLKAEIRFLDFKFVKSVDENIFKTD